MPRFPAPARRGPGGLRRRLLPAILAILIAAAGAGYWFILRPNREIRRVRRRIDALEQLLSHKPKTGAIQLAIRNQSLLRLFAARVQVEVPEAGFNREYSAEELAAVISRGLLLFRWTNLRFYDRQIHLDPPDSARVEATARFRAENRSGARIDEIREVRCELRKRNGKWRFFHLSEVQVLRR